MKYAILDGKLTHISKVKKEQLPEFLDTVMI